MEINMADLKNYFINELEKFRKQIAHYEYVEQMRSEASMNLYGSASFPEMFALTHFEIVQNLLKKIELFSTVDDLMSSIANEIANADKVTADTLNKEMSYLLSSIDEVKKSSRGH